VHDIAACPQDMLDVSMAMRKVARVLWSLHAAFAEVCSELDLKSAADGGVVAYQTMVVTTQQLWGLSPIDPVPTSDC